MDPESIDERMPCHGVRKFNLPQTADIVIMILASLVVIVNSFEIISVLKNYRRLRQRIYVSVISFAAANILGGVIFLADAANQAANRKYEQNQEDVAVVYYTSTSEGLKFVSVKQDKEVNFAQELLETFKAGCIVLSVLNTALVTFALYKRTTSMGRHHEDFMNVDGSLGPDGHPFLPAFDTMMRVLSIGTPAVVNGLNKNSGRGSAMMQNSKKYPLRRASSGSRMSSSSIQPDEVGSGTRKSQVVKSLAENPPRKAPTKRNGSMGRLGRRISHAFRSRSASGIQPYVGRHSNSVMSKSATGGSLFLIWLTFVVTCTLPMVLRRVGNAATACPDKCMTLEIAEITPNNNETIMPSGIMARRNSTLAPPTQGTEYSSRNGIVILGKSLNQSDPSAAPRADNGPTNVGNLYKAISLSKESKECIPPDYRQFFKPNTLGSVERTTKSPCPSCSVAFYPMSKSHMIFVSLVVFFTWCWLIVSASRLLYLRKHSSNVFVRCSALWRFMFMTAIFYLATMAPYVCWIVLDVTTASSAEASPVWYAATKEKSGIPNGGHIYFPKAKFSPSSRPQTLALTDADWSTVVSDNDYLFLVCGIVSSCLLLVNFAVAPSLYLVRLLGFRRIISAL